MENITIEVTTHNVHLFERIQHILKTPTIGDKLTVVHQHRPYVNKRGQFAIVTDFTPSPNTQMLIARGDYADAPKYGWKGDAEIAEKIIREKKIENYYAFNKWYIDQKELSKLLKRSRSVSVKSLN
jgi:hypothetical protein